MPILQRLLLSSNITSKRTIFSSSIWLSKKDPSDAANQSSSSSSSSSSSESDSDDEKVKLKNQVDKKETANQKLSDLLKRMVEEEKSMPIEEKLNLAKPRQIERAKVMAKKEEKRLDEKLASAAKEVAEDLGGDVKQTEMELLERLLYKKSSTNDSEKTSTPKSKKKAADEDSKQELGNLSLSELLAEMKIDRSKPKPPVNYESRAEQVRTILKKQEVRSPPVRQRPPRPSPLESQSSERVDLFGAEPFGFFKDLKVDPVNKEVKMDVWDKCFKRELKMAVTQPPRNIYEEMIQWTDRGMLWHFPIDNEQGLEEEKQVYFSEHVHLEHHLEDWCPDKGPIRNFMELVCVGLSKNYWLTVEEKKAHLQWFKEFFISKRVLIKEIGAGDIQPNA